ncbi:unnamed protein product, partial [Anisakis simplex]
MTDALKEIGIQDVAVSEAEAGVSSSKEMAFVALGEGGMESDDYMRYKKLEKTMEHLE